MGAKNKIRSVEKAILSGLEADARISFSKLGKQIRKSQQQISYTVNSLMEKDILRRFYTIIDYSKLNVLNFRVYFKVTYISQEKFDELLNYLMSEPYTAWIDSCGGRYDMVCTFLALNPSQFNKTLKGIMAKFPEQLQNYTVLTTIVIHQFGRKYLFKQALPNAIIAGGDRKPEEVDEIDLKILRELSEDARISAVKIGEILSLTPKTIIQRMKKLHDRKIVLGYRQSLNPRNMGYISNLLVVKYHNVSVDAENELINYLKVHPHVIGVVKTLGEWDIEIMIEAPETAELRKIEMEIRQKFIELIKQIESIPLYRTYKTNFFPGFLVGK